MRIDAVFSGGGVKAFAFIGALQCLEENDYRLERVAGTSAGAIIASLIAASYQAEEIKRLIFQINLKKFLDPPWFSKKIPLLKAAALYFQKGLYRGEVFEKWLEEKLAERGIITFADLKKDHLKVIASDITLGKLIIIPDDLEQIYGIARNQFKIATAVRISAGFPYFFMPKTLMNNKGEPSYLVDGGLLSNFPLWLFQEGQREQRPVLGVTLSESLTNQTPEYIKNGFDMLQGIFKAMMKAHDSRYISTSKTNNIVFIPVKKVKTTHMNLSTKEKLSLIQLGKDTTAKFIKTWSH